MISYTLSCANRLSQIVQISLSFEVSSHDRVELCLPAWRPGRYEFQTYARQLFDVTAQDSAKKPLSIQKSARNTWALTSEKAGRITVSYQFSCTQLDAGGSWVDDVLFYINPINCLLYLKNRDQEACQLTLNIPLLHPPAGNLLFEKGTAQVPHYFRLADSPFFLSEQYAHDSYTVGDSVFHISTHGNMAFSPATLKKHFQDFTDVQLKAMAVFPEKEYHFLLLLLPFTHYHGVEHHESTVITLGPSKDLANTPLYEELISISSHELYHAWNICKIRPQEMYPYKLHEENYFRTGFVAEGITTYLGEYFLLQSGFFSEERFLLEIEQWLNRHRMHRGIPRASLSDSSFDLWVDGYVASSADYKVSIYVAGALSAISLDLLIRSQDNKKSIFDLMKILYASKALQQQGYDEQYLKEEIKKLIPITAESFWKACIEGHQVDEFVIEQLSHVGITVVEKSSAYMHERLLGIKVKPSATKVEIGKIKVDSIAADAFMVDDIILSVNEVNTATLEELDSALLEPNLVEFAVLRKGRELRFSLPIPTTTNHWSSLQVQKNSDASESQKRRYQEWMKVIA